ncbi:hypothetical protein [Amycolatopsis orientalis]|uniref:hypothetical protein n=1 Tax=Amycolatopsis orientalis TaxID=31958 RepID=UPI00131A26B0|nr:hypothetical protein [Amycolatopsis orientalis]
MGTAEGAATAAQAAADDARKANALFQQQHVRERRPAGGSFRSHARKLGSTLTGSGGYAVMAMHDANKPFCNVVLEDIRLMDQPL